MRKNGSREISFSQYRTTDMFLFAVIVAVAELFAFAATVWFPEEAIFSFSFMLPLALTVMMRWGWPSVFYAVGSGLIYCALHSCGWQYFLAWSVGNASIIVVLAYLIPIGKERVAKSWLLSLGMVLIAWAAMVLVRSAVFAAATGAGYVQALAYFCGISTDSGLLTLVMGMLSVIVIRRFDGLFEDQKAYLVRIGKMREEQRKRDTFGEELAEIDEEQLSILNNDDSELY